MKKQTAMAIATICAIWIMYFAYQARFHPPEEVKQQPVESQTEQTTPAPALPAVQSSSPASLSVRNTNLKEETFSVKTKHFDCEFS